MKILYFVFHCKMMCIFFLLRKKTPTQIFLFLKIAINLSVTCLKLLKEKNRLTDNSITIDIKVSIFNAFKF